jgi:hypothetical protein
MHDVFHYQVPYGIAGKLFNHLILKRYLTNLLLTRNTFIKQAAESCNRVVK